MSQSLSRKMKRAAARPGPNEIVPCVKNPDATTAGSTVPISVTIIAKNTAQSLAKTLESLRKNFLRDGDELLVLDTGSTDDTVAVAKKYGARVLLRPDLKQDFRPYVEKWLPEKLASFDGCDLASGCIMDFGEARRIASEAAKHDHQFWIDADDELVEKVPGKLRAIADKVLTASDKQRDAIFLDYQYSYDKDGSVSSILKRERIHDRRVYRWVGRCHEVCIPREGVSPKGAAYFVDLDSVLAHRRDHNDAARLSDIRNYVILRKELEDTSGREDPRTIFYLGNAARGLGRDVEAIELYTRFLDRSGSRDDRFAAAYGCAVILFAEKNRRPLDALDHLWNCIKLKPEDPRGYFGVARCYFQLGRWQESLHWFNIGKMLPEPKDCLHNYSPIQIHLHPYVLAAHTYKELGLEAKACECVDLLKNRYPNHPDVKETEMVIGNWIAGERLVESVGRMVANSQPKTTEEAMEIGRAIVAHMASIPEKLEDSGLARLEPPDTREGRPLAIWCGKAIEAWGPRSGDAGIGGSEKAVIQMAPRLQARGFAVTVYANTPADQRGIDGRTNVNWQHFGAFDRARQRGTIIYWRAPHMLELPFNAEKRILWCHDVQNAANWTPARVAIVDEVWVLSEFHATTLGVARAELGDKVVVTRNGIDADLFRKYFGTVARDPKKAIYASSPDRGVLTAIRLFQEANVPRSTLDIYYGFNRVFMTHAARQEYGCIPDLGRDASYWDYMQTVHRAIDKDDRIKLVGRVGWEELARRMCGAGSWLYPTRFDEISCMAAQEAQAAGLVPVATRHAALAETVLEGPECTVDGLRKALTLDYDRKALHERACEAFDYEKLADEWSRRLGA